MKFLDEITAEDMRMAAQQLARSEKGRHAMDSLLQLMNEGGVSLDHANQFAYLTLLWGCWGGFAGTARDEMATAIEESNIQPQRRMSLREIKEASQLFMRLGKGGAK